MLPRANQRRQLHTIILPWTNSPVARLARSSISIANPSSMALQEVTHAFIKRLRLSERPWNAAWQQQCLRPRRHASSQAGDAKQELRDLEETSFRDTAQPDELDLATFDPVANSVKRNHILPPSRSVALCAACRDFAGLTFSISGIPTVHHSTTADRCTLISRRATRTPCLVDLFLGPSACHASSKPITPPSLQIS